MTSPKSKIPLLDPLDSSPKQVVNDANVLWSSDAVWKGIVAEAYNYETLELPEFQVVNHNIVLHLAHPSTIELSIDGHYETQKRLPGDLSLFPAGTVCSVRSRQQHQVLVVSLSHEVMSPVIEDFQRRIIEPYPIAHLEDPHIQHICKAMQAEATAQFSSGQLYGESLGVALAVRFMRRYARSVPSIRRGGLPPRMLRRVVDFIDAELHTPLRMGSLAEIAGLSEFRFAHNFKTETGMSPHQYVMHARIERAKRLLRETRMTVVEIALSVGLQSSSQFNALFKRELGITPRAFRRSFR